MNSKSFFLSPKVLPLATGALAFKGIPLQPVVAALFMSLSTIHVAINAVLLKHKKLE